MAHIDEWRPVTSVPQGPDLVREDLKRHFWAWYRMHERDVIIKRHILFWSVTIIVRDLKFLFIQLFGTEI